MMNAERIIEVNLYAYQTRLVEEALGRGMFDYDDIVNAPEEDQEGNVTEILEWLLVSDWLAERLEERGSPILKNEFGTWWGRQTSGQQPFQDPVIRVIAGDTPDDKDITMVKVENLMELTGQESGIVVYGNGEAIVCNWVNVSGLPRVSMAGIIGLNEEIDKVEGLNGRIEDYVDAGDVIYKDNDDGLKYGDATIYKLPGEIIIIAPKGWN